MTKIVFTLLLTATSLSWQPFSSRATLGTQQRLINRTDVVKDEPIVITDVRVGEMRVSFDKPFVADDNWINAIALSIKNTSSQRILYAQLDLSFPRPEGSSESIAMTDMFAVGNRALQQRPPSDEERFSGLAPGMTTEIRLSDIQCDGLKRFLKDTNYSTSIDKVELRLGAIIFEDDTMWYLGAHMRRGKDPTLWEEFKPPGSKEP